MTVRLLIDESPLEVRAALMENDTVTRLWFSASAVDDSLYQGKIVKTDQRLGGAFVDIGTGVDGFLPVLEGQMPQEGALMLVQVKRPASARKGALLTREITLATPVFSWKPLAGKRKLGAPPNMTSADEKARLMTAFNEKGFKGDLAIRPFAAGMAPDALRQAFSGLRHSWDASRETASASKEVGLISDKPGTVAKALLSDFADQPIEEIIIAGPDLLTAMRQCVNNHLPHRRLPVEAASSSGLFEQEGVEEAITSALSREVTLQGGGRLIFDEAEALTAIDVDVAATSGQSKKGAIIRACVEAVPVITQQLMLRQIGGQVVIDFPALAMKTAPGKSGGPVLSALKDGLKTLPSARLGRLNDRGVILLTLPRKGASLLEQVTEITEAAPVPGRQWRLSYLAAGAVRAAQRQLEQRSSAKFELVVNHQLADYMKENSSWQERLVNRYGDRLTLTGAEDVTREHIDVREI
jgi:ribonuclease E